MNLSVFLYRLLHAIHYYFFGHAIRIIFVINIVTKDNKTPVNIIN